MFLVALARFGLLVALTAPLIAGAAAAQNAPQSSFYIEAFGNSAAFEDANVSLNYDVAFPNALGVRLGASTEVDRMRPDQTFVLLGTFNYIVGADGSGLELGLGPMVRVGRREMLAATGTVGFRLQPFFDRWVVRVAYAPTLTVDGYRGYPGLSVGMLVNNE